jgi:hypothetical protein
MVEDVEHDLCSAETKMTSDLELWTKYTLWFIIARDFGKRKDCGKDVPYSLHYEEELK